VSGPRVIAVCGYSDGSREALHEICSRRLRRAEREANADDVVLLTGWARCREAASEAELMARSWAAPCRRLVVDPGARSTFANVVAAATVARAVGAPQVVLVTSRWHAPRASALLRAALHGSESSAAAVTTDERPPPGARLRELVCWTLVPFAVLALVGRAQCFSAWSGWSGWSGWSTVAAGGVGSAPGVEPSTVPRSPATPVPEDA
jgi:uncharacterized SAM-binding protein YcdF (DUF218 family)